MNDNQLRRQGMDTPQTSLELIRKLSAVGIALSAEKDNARLMELILQSAKEVTNADGGTLYTRTEDNKLTFEIMLTESLGIHMGVPAASPSPCRRSGYLTTMTFLTTRWWRPAPR